MDKIIFPCLFINSNTLSGENGIVRSKIWNACCNYEPVPSRSSGAVMACSPDSSSSSSYSGPILFLVLAMMSSCRRSLNEMWNTPICLASWRPWRVFPAPLGPRIRRRIGGGCKKKRWKKTLLKTLLSNWNALNYNKKWNPKHGLGTGSPLGVRTKRKKGGRGRGGSSSFSSLPVVEPVLSTKEFLYFFKCNPENLAC